jgi:hypothetical protein
MYKFIVLLLCNVFKIAVKNDFCVKIIFSDLKLAEYRSEIEQNVPDAHFSAAEAWMPNQRGSYIERETQGTWGYFIEIAR